MIVRGWPFTGPWQLAHGSPLAGPGWAHGWTWLDLAYLPCLAINWPWLVWMDLTGWPMVAMVAPGCWTRLDMAGAGPGWLVMLGD